MTGHDSADDADQLVGGDLPEPAGPVEGGGRGDDSSLRGPAGGIQEVPRSHQGQGEVRRSWWGYEVKARSLGNDKVIGAVKVWNNTQYEDQ